MLVFRRTALLRQFEQIQQDMFSWRNIKLSVFSGLKKKKKKKKKSYEKKQLIWCHEMFTKKILSFNLESRNVNKNTSLIQNAPFMMVLFYNYPQNLNLFNNYALSGR